MGRALGHPEYLEATNKAIEMLKNDRIRILKTDIFNEITLRHPTPGGILLNLKRDPATMELHAIEYDEKKVFIAWYMQMEHFVKVTRGDMRNLPYEDKYFDLVLDLSTLDHIRIEDIEQVFLQYNKVLKDKGLLVLFSWCADFYTYGYAGPGIDMWHFDNQYWFPPDQVREKLQCYFNILEEEKGYVYMWEKMNLIGPQNNNYFMYRFLGEKK